MSMPMCARIGRFGRQLYVPVPGVDKPMLSGCEHERP